LTTQLFYQMQSLEKILSIQSNLGPRPCFCWLDDELQPINDDDPRTGGTRTPTDLGTWLTVTRLGFFRPAFPFGLKNPQPVELPRWRFCSSAYSHAAAAL
jgi:hypothetical protein